VEAGNRQWTMGNKQFKKSAALILPYLKNAYANGKAMRNRKLTNHKSFASASASAFIGISAEQMLQLQECPVPLPCASFHMPMSNHPLLHMPSL